MTEQTGPDRGPWMQTYSGRAYYPLAPDPADICIEDLAHHLSIEPRFSGATRLAYSVAQHSILASWLLDPEHPRYILTESFHHLPAHGLMHDASEAYLRDLNRGLKEDPEFGPVYRRYETMNMLAVWRRFGLPPGDPPEVKWVDNILLATEKRDLMPPEPHPWLPLPDPLEWTIEPWTAAESEERFLARYLELQSRGLML